MYHKIKNDHLYIFLKNNVLFMVESLRHFDAGGALKFTVV